MVCKVKVGVEDYEANRERIRALDGKTKRVGTKKAGESLQSLKRRSRIVKAIWTMERKNEKREVGLTGRSFGRSIDIAKKYPNTTKAVKAVREGRFALALGRPPKSVKRKPTKIIRPRRWMWKVQEWLGGLWLRLWWLLS